MFTHDKHRFELVVRDLALSTTRIVHANFILACHGVHGRQLTSLGGALADTASAASARARHAAAAS